MPAPSTNRTLAILVAATALSVLGGAALAAPFLNNCRPDPDCDSRDKPCFREISQSNPNVVLRGDESLSSALPKSAIRVRICTAVDPVCPEATPGQRLNVMAFNTNGDTLYLQGLSAMTGITDTGGYTELPPHAYLGVSCFNDDEPCRIAWQHCFVESPQMLKKKGGGTLTLGGATKKGGKRRPGGFIAR